MRGLAQQAVDDIVAVIILISVILLLSSLQFLDKVVALFDRVEHQSQSKRAFAEQKRVDFDNRNSPLFHISLHGN